MIFILAFSLNMDVVILRENITGSDKSFHLKYILKLGEREISQSRLAVAGHGALELSTNSETRRNDLRCRNCSFNLQFR